MRYKGTELLLIIDEVYGEIVEFFDFLPRKRPLMNVPFLVVFTGIVLALVLSLSLAPFIFYGWSFSIFEKDKALTILIVYKLVPVGFAPLFLLLFLRLYSAANSLFLLPSLPSWRIVAFYACFKSP